MGLYLLSLTLGMSALSPYLKAWWVAFTQPASFQPDLMPLWLLAPLTLGFLLMGVAAVSRATASEPPRRWLSLGIFVGCAVIVLIRFALPLRHASASEAYAHASAYLKAVSEDLRRYYRAHGRYPDASSIADAIRTRESPWLAYGRSLAYRVVYEEGVGPRLRARASDRVGTIYYVRTSEGQRYWLTMLVLAGAPTGRYDFLRDGNGRPLVVSRGRVQPTTEGDVP